MAKDDPHFRLRIPHDLKRQVEKAAAESGRSMNAEVLIRLEQSFQGYFLDMSGAGFNALVMRFEATVEALEDLYARGIDEIVEHRMAQDREKGTKRSRDQILFDLAREKHDAETGDQPSEAPDKRASRGKRTPRPRRD